MHGAELRRLRRQLELTQTQLAEEVEVTANTVARWERDEIAVPTAVAKLIRLLAERSSKATAVTSRRASLRDPHHEAIVARLSGQLNDQVFEECAADLLRRDWPGLVPVRGGSDDGFDGAVAEEEGEPFPLVSTVGRDAKSNLTRNLRRAIDRGWKPGRAIFATPRALKPSTRRALFDAAFQVGVRLVQVYEQDWFANVLYHEPSWCKKLLDLPGRPSALSVVPRTRRPLLGDVVIGRDQELRQLREIDHDCLIVGVPGAGKTFLLRALALEGLALFVTDDDREALADAIRMQSPKTIIVDDAHIRSILLEELVQLRKQMHAKFLIIAASWPGAKREISAALGLQSSNIIELGLLDADSMVEIVKTVGIHGPNLLIRSIIRQAEGRPGLAVTLSYLCIRGDIERVMLGEAIDNDLGDFLARSVGPKYAALLGAFALAGAGGVQPEIVSRFLGTSMLDLMTTLSQLAAAGVIRQSHDGSIAVTPDPFRWILVRNTFFSPPFLDYRPLLARLPDKKDAVQTLVGARSRGAIIPELESLIQEIDSPELWAEYASLGLREVVYVLHHRPDLVVVTADAGLRFSPERTIPMLLDQAVGDNRQLSSTPAHPLRKIEDWAAGARPREDDVAMRRQVTVREVTKWWNRSGESIIAMKALCMALTPEFSYTEADPGRGMTVTITSGLLGLRALRELEALWPSVFEVINASRSVPWVEVIHLIHKWLQPRIRGEIPTSVMEMMQSNAKCMINDILGVTKQHPAIQLSLVEMARNNGMRISVQIDREYILLYGRDRKDYQRSSDLSWRIAQRLVKKWLGQGVKWAVSRIVWLESEAKLVGRSYPRRMPYVCRELSARVLDPSAFARRLMGDGVSPDLVDPFLRRAVEGRDHNLVDLLTNCIQSESYRGIAISTVITHTDLSEDLISTAIQCAGDYQEIIRGCALCGLVPEPTMFKLLQSKDERVALAAAEGEWISDPKGSVRESVAQAWRSAVLKCRKNDYWINQILASDPELAYEWLIARAVEEDIFLFFVEEETLDLIVEVLSREKRINVLHYLRPEFGKRSLIKNLVANDVEVYRNLLQMKHLSAEHLAPLEGPPDEDWARKVTVALDAGYPSDEVLSATLPTMWSWAGNESDFWAEWRAKFEAYCDHPDARIRSVAATGAGEMRERTERLRERERREAVYVA